MRRALAVLVVSSACALGLAEPAGAELECSTKIRQVVVRGAVESIAVRVCRDTPGPAPGDGGETPDDDVREQINRQRDRVISPVCRAAAEAVGADAEEFCGGEEQSPQELTLAFVTRAFRSTALPPARLVIQPPNGRTLVNFETNFYTAREPFRRRVSVLGQRVELEITPQSFEWRFGDGTSRTTTTPGAPYPDLEVTHEYQSLGEVNPSLATTYGARWRLAGGAWRPVPGTATVAGDPQTLTVVSARPTLVTPSSR